LDKESEVDIIAESWTKINEGGQKRSKMDIKRENWIKIEEGGQKGVRQT